MASDQGSGAGADRGADPAGRASWPEAIGEAARELLPVDPEASDWDACDSPRHALASFVAAMDRVALGDEDAWERARRLLPDPEDESVEQRSAARDLARVLDRLGELETLRLPGRREVAEEGLRRYPYFPSPRFDWVWSRLEEPPQGSIELELTPSGCWTFTPETLAGASLLARTTAGLPPRRGPQDAGIGLLELFAPTFDRTPWEGWATFAALLAAGLAGALGSRALLRRLGDWLEQRGQAARGAVIRSLASPLALVVLVLVGVLALEAIHVEATLRELAMSWVEIAMVIGLGWLIFNLVDLVELGLHSWADRGQAGLGRSFFSLTSAGLKSLVVIVFLIAALEGVLDYDVTGFLAGLGIIGLGLSLAAKESFQNVMGSLTVLLDKPFQVGDLIRFKGALGQVESIGLRSTRLRLVDGDVVIQPNMAFIGEQIENLSLRPFIRRELELALPYDSTPEQVERALEIVREVLTDAELAEAGRFDLDRLPPRISFKEFEESCLGLSAYYWFHTSGPRESDWFAYLDHASQVNVEIVRRFAAEGLEMAFPTRTVHLASTPEESEPGPGKRPDGDERPGDGREEVEREGAGRARGRQTTPVSNDAGPSDPPTEAGDGEP